MQARIRGNTRGLRPSLFLTDLQSAHPHGVQQDANYGRSTALVLQPTHPHGVRQWKEKLRFYVRLSTRSREPLWKERQQNLAIKQKRVKALLKLFCEFLWKTKIT